MVTKGQRCGEEVIRKAVPLRLARFGLVRTTLEHLEPNDGGYWCDYKRTNRTLNHSRRATHTQRFLVAIAGSASRLKLTLRSTASTIVHVVVLVHRILQSPLSFYSLGSSYSIGTSAKTSNEVMEE